MGPKKMKSNKIKKIHIFYNPQQPVVALYLSSSSTRRPLTKCFSMPEMNKRTNKRQEFYSHAKHLQIKTIHVASMYFFDNCLYPFHYSYHTKFNDCRFQLSTHVERCCCINSDIIFGMMKSLYGGHKKKNCDNCDYILVRLNTTSTKNKQEKVRKTVKIVKDKTPTIDIPVSKPLRPLKLIEKFEKILKSVLTLKVPILKGTLSEKDLIHEQSAESHPQNNEEKADGLWTRLKNKACYIFKADDLLTESQKASQRQLMDNNQNHIGLNLERKPPSLKERNRKPQTGGGICLFTDKTEKERLLQRSDNGAILFPKERSCSEKDMVKKLKLTRTRKTPSEKLRPSEGTGFLAPPEEKETSQNEKRLAKTDVLLLEGKTPSAKDLVDNSQMDLGLTLALRNKSQTAQTVGIITLFENKILARKRKKLSPKKIHENATRLISLEKKHSEKIKKDMQRLTEFKSPFREAKTPSEQNKELELKVNTPPKTIEQKYNKSFEHSRDLPSTDKEKLRSVQADLLPPKSVERTSVEKSFKAKIKANKALTKISSEKLQKSNTAGFLTPLKDKSSKEQQRMETKCPAETKNIACKSDFINLPSKPSPSIKLRYKKSPATEVMKPLIGKTSPGSKRILKKHQNTATSLHKGRSPSESKIVNRLNSVIMHNSASENMKAAKCAGNFAVLQKKKSMQNEYFRRGLAIRGMPISKGETLYEKVLIDAIRSDVGLSPQPKTSSFRLKIQKSYAAGIIAHQENKKITQKKNIQITLVHGNISKPKGGTTPEKSLIPKIKADSKLKNDSPEKLRIVKSTDLLISLGKKGLKQQEKRIGKIVECGLSLRGVETPSTKEKHNKAVAADTYVNLRGLSPIDKDKVQRAQIDMLQPKHEERTRSQKILVAKVKASQASTKISSVKLHKSKDTGLLKHFEDKKLKKENSIIKGLTEPEPSFFKSTTPPKSWNHTFRTKLETSPAANISLKKSDIYKFNAKSVFRPLTDKLDTKKGRTFGGPFEAVLPSSEGVVSENYLLKKVKSKVRLPAELTIPKRMGKNKKQSTNLCISEAQLTKVYEAAKLEDAIKTHKCDRCCGYDNKKIRFKPSYIKIRVTSPDIMSSLCNFRNKCIRGINSGPFLSSKDIKVIVAKAAAILLQPNSFDNLNEIYFASSAHSSRTTDIIDNDQNNNTDTSIHRFPVLNCSSDTSCSLMSYSIISESDNHSQLNSTPPYDGGSSESDEIDEFLRYYLSSADILRNLARKSISSRSSFDSFLVIKTDTSLCSTTSATNNSSSIMCVADRSNCPCNPPPHSSDRQAGTVSRVGYSTTNDRIVSDTAALARINLVNNAIRRRHQIMYVNEKRSRKQTSICEQLEEFRKEMTEMLKLFSDKQQQPEIEKITLTLSDIQQTHTKIENSISYLYAQNEELQKKIDNLEHEVKEDKKCITLLENELKEFH